MTGETYLQGSASLVLDQVHCVSHLRPRVPGVLTIVIWLVWKASSPFFSQCAIYMIGAVKRMEMN